MTAAPRYFSIRATGIVGASLSVEGADWPEAPAAEGIAVLVNADIGLKPSLLVKTTCVEIWKKTCRILFCTKLPMPLLVLATVMVMFGNKWLLRSAQNLFVATANILICQKATITPNAMAVVRNGISTVDPRELRGVIAVSVV
jgi:hypothetical protein